MAKQRLLNTFSWSASRDSTFRECKKRYWYMYYGSWDGWPLYYNDPRGTTVDVLSQYLYTLKNMQSLAIYVGSVVHKAIESALRVSCSTSSTVKQLPTLQTILEQAEKTFLKGIDESKKGAWKQHPKKHTNLLEHYYNLTLPSEALEKARMKIKNCLTNWYTSPCIQKIALDTKRASWGEIERTMTFAIEASIQATAVFDFSLSWKRTKDSTLPLRIIFDWKTGQQTQTIEDQLYVYALSAHTVWQTPYDAMLLVPFYLAEGPLSYKKIGAEQSHKIDEAKIDSTKEKIVTSSNVMLQLHTTSVDAKGASIKPNPVAFAYTEQKYKCQKCPFVEICEKADYKEKDETALRSLILSSAAM